VSNSINNINYYAEQQCSIQWRAFLTAFAKEFSERGEASDLRNLMHRLGRSMAASFSVAEGGTLSGLEESMNRVWFDLNWGWVRLSEQTDCLLLEHNAAPLKVAFGEDALTWTPALLEGIYAQWFETLGVDKSLKLTQRGAALEGGQLLEFQLKKHVEESSFLGRR
jgi:hypothetical protein